MKRKPYQGLVNIIRFNWHFYVIAGTAIASAWILWADAFPDGVRQLIVITAIFASFCIVTSLAVSLYIYDLSDLYHLKWLGNIGLQAPASRVLNIHAGFDEISGILMHKYGKSAVTICDFYNPETHTEVSIKRARKAYPPHPATITATADNLPFSDGAFDLAVVMLAAHEIRNRDERMRFFKEIRRITGPSGSVVVTEHLRDLNNFLAYSAGFLHFYPRTSWLRTFKAAGLIVKQEIKSTPFITTFILEQHGNAS